MRILLVEDEAELATALSSALRRYDMVVDHAPTLADAEEAISADVHAAVLLDRQLPDGDGLTLIPKLRWRPQPRSRWARCLWNMPYTSQS
jgi:DNA-binding response OmpR family regulator